MHIGTQHLAQVNDPGLPCGQVTVLWGVALASLATRRLSLWAFPLLALGLLAGWSSVYLGVHFPFDVLAALPVALVGSGAAVALRTPLSPAFGWILCLYDRWARLLSAALQSSRKT